MFLRHQRPLRALAPSSYLKSTKPIRRHRMLACTCTNSFYERFRPPANLTHQPKFDFHPTTARTNSNPSRRPVRNKAVTLSGEKLSSRPEQTCHYPRFWPDSHCLKTSNRRLTCHLTSMHQTAELLAHRFPPTTYRPTTSYRALTIELLQPDHFIPGPKATRSLDSS